ncbi:MAG: OmpH family outer membrane protein [Bacteroidota bacterium]
MQRMHENSYKRTCLILWSCLVFTLLSGLIASAQAQNQKIGYIDSDYILNKIPEYEGVQQRLNLLSENWRKDIEELDKELQELKEEFAAKEILYTDEVKQQKQKQIEQKAQEKQRLIDQKFGADGEYFQKQKQLLEPIQRRIMEAVQTVAQSESFDYVFDRSGDFTFMYTRADWDLSEKVLIELGIEVDQASN